MQSDAKDDFALLGGLLVKRWLRMQFISSQPGLSLFMLYRVAPKMEQSISLGLYSDQQLSFYTLLDRASFPHYNNIKIIKFGWELFILRVISYGPSFSGFAISLSLIVLRNSGNRQIPKMTVHKKLLIK